MTPTQTRLKEAIRRALDSGAWERIPEAPGYVIRYKEEDIPTPAYASRGMWPGETYDRWVFLTIVGGQKWTILLRVFVVPWVGARDQVITFSRAFDVLGDPAKELER